MPNYRKVARESARRYGIDPNIYERQIEQESAWRPDVVSPAGAIGISQIMPQTAKAWGVNPRDPVASLDVAARQMSRYLKQYGGDWTKALTAYNAGPGNVGKSLPAETRNYISTILHDRTTARQQVSKTATVPAVVAPSEGGGPESSAPAHPHAGLLAQVLARRHGDSAIVRSLQARAQETKPAPSDLSSSPAAVQRSTGANRGAPSPPGGKSGKSRLLELFYQGPGGIDVKNGRVVPQGFVSGHQDHVHVASGPRTAVALGKLAQQMGLHVGENPHFGGVAPVHAENSYHYRNGGQAIDVSGTPEQMRKYAHRIARMYGLKA